MIEKINLIKIDIDNYTTTFSVVSSSLSAAAGLGARPDLDWSEMKGWHDWRDLVTISSAGQGSTVSHSQYNIIINTFTCQLAAPAAFS